MNSFVKILVVPPTCSLQQRVLGDGGAVEFLCVWNESGIVDRENSFVVEPEQGYAMVIIEEEVEQPFFLAFFLFFFFSVRARI